MANTLYTADQVAAVAVVMAAEDLVLAPTFSVALEGDFQPGGGNRVLLKVPAALIARDRDLADKTSAIVVDELTEATVPVSLDTHALSAVGLSEEDLSLNLSDFSRQVLRPQMDAVVDRVEKAAADVLLSVAEDGSIAYDAAAPVKTFTALRRALRAKGTDTATASLVAVVGSDIADDLLDSGALDFEKTGNAEALRNGVIGRVRGFDVVESGRIPADEIIAYPKTGMWLAVKAPAVPVGAAFGEKVTDRGFSLRYLRDYDADRTQDRSIVSTFVGGAVMPAYKVTRNYATGAVSVTAQPGGHVVRVATSTPAS